MIVTEYKWKIVNGWLTQSTVATSRCCFAHKVLVCCERGDYNFSLIGSNNACSDINSYYYDYNYVIIIMLTMNELNVIKIIIK